MKTLVTVAKALMVSSIIVLVVGCSTPPSTTVKLTTPLSVSPTAALSSFYTINELRVLDKKIKSLGLNADNFPPIDGATSTQPIRSLIAASAFNGSCEWFETSDEEMFLWTNFEKTSLSQAEKQQIIAKTSENSKTHDAYMKLIQSKIDLILVSTRPSDAELEEARKLGVKLELVPIGLDGFVFLVNQSNPVTNLNTADIIDIYRSKISNWKQLNGQDRPISAFTRQPNSGSQELMLKLVMKDIALNVPTPTPDFRSITSMSMLITGVESDENSIGYSLYYYKNNMIDKRENLPKIKLIAVDGIAPNPDTISSKTYPYVFNIYAVTRADQPHDSRAYQLKEWLTSREGQEIIKLAGYSPLQ